jgi:hypothetical protein
MVLLIAIALIPLGVGLPLTAFALNAMRGLQDKTWRRVAGWQGFAVAAPASGPAGDEARDAGFLVRFGALVADPGTWRSLMRSTVDILAGLPLMLAPPVVIVWGLFGLAMPAIWHQLANAHDNNWYAFIHVTTTSTAWLSVVLGIAFIAFGLLLAPEALRHYAALARSLRASD